MNAVHLCQAYKKSFVCILFIGISNFQVRQVAMVKMSYLGNQNWAGQKLSLWNKSPALNKGRRKFSKLWYGSIVVKCKKFTFWSVIFFCLKLPNSSRKSIKDNFNCKIQNVRVQQHNLFVKRKGQKGMLFNSD